MKKVCKKYLKINDNLIFHKDNQYYMDESGKFIMCENFLPFYLTDYTEKNMVEWKSNIGVNFIQVEEFFE